MLKDSVSLDGNVNQILNHFCRSLVKPSMSQQFLKLAEKVEESSEWHFGDYIMEKS